MRFSPVLRIVVIYIVVAGLWIVGSDQVVEFISPDAESITNFQTYKGLAYVILTALLLYFLLRQAFNQRQSVEDQLRELNETLEKRIEERTKELETANHNLTEAEQAKTQFIADVSHELRNPMTNLNMVVHLLKKAPPDKRDPYILRLETGINNLDGLMREVLDLSKLDSDSYQTNFQPIDLNQLIQQVIDSIQATAQSKDLNLIFKNCANAAIVQGVEQQLKQVVMNLLTNAIHYTSTGQIIISTRYSESTQGIEIEVQDTGAGIPADELPHIFKRFYRGRDNAVKQVQGTGLGLSITQGIVQRHQGNIQVKSELNVGTTFIISLPIAYQPAAS